MRRFVTLVVLFLFYNSIRHLDLGLRQGRRHAVFCNGGDTGPVVGTVNDDHADAQNLWRLPEPGADRPGHLASGNGLQWHFGHVSSYTYGVFDANGHQSNDLLADRRRRSFRCQCRQALRRQLEPQHRRRNS